MFILKKTLYFTLFTFLLLNINSIMASDINNEVFFDQSKFKLTFQDNMLSMHEDRGTKISLLAWGNKNYENIIIFDRYNEFDNLSLKGSLLEPTHLSITGNLFNSQNNFPKNLFTFSGFEAPILTAILDSKIQGLADLINIMGCNKEIQKVLDTNENWEIIYGIVEKNFPIENMNFSYVSEDIKAEESRLKENLLNLKKDKKSNAKNALEAHVKLYKFYKHYSNDPGKGIILRGTRS